MSAHPFSFEQARTAINTAKRAMRDAETARKEATEKAAEAERAYRMALAQQIVREHADGAAWTVAQDLARGNDRVAELRYLRDVARGVQDAAEGALWRHTADRKDLGRLVDWSRAVDVRLAAGVPDVVPDFSPYDRTQPVGR